MTVAESFDGNDDLGSIGCNLTYHPGLDRLAAPSTLLMRTTAYRLIRGATVLGTVTHNPAQSDFPWHGGIFEPAPEFDVVRSLFEDELQLLDADRIEEWEIAWAQIEKPGLRLEPVGGGEPITELLIHIDGAKTWWRC